MHQMSRMRDAPDRVKGLYAPAVAGTVADGPIIKAVPPLRDP